MSLAGFHDIRIIPGKYILCSVIRIAGAKDQRIVSQNTCEHAAHAGTADIPSVR